MEPAAMPLALRANWRGGLPLLAEAVDTEYEQGSVPLPTYTFASRHSYLPHALSSVLATLRGLCVVPARMQEVWFAVDGVAVNWQMPLGALFDVHCGQGDLPFRVTIHLGSARPHVLPCPGPDKVRRDFFHWFKQGMYLRFHSRLPFTEFREDDDDALWESVVGGNVDRYWAVMRRLQGHPVKAIPIRIIFLREPRGGKFTGSEAASVEVAGSSAGSSSSSSSSSSASEVALDMVQLKLPLESTVTLGQLVDEHAPLRILMDGRCRVRCQGIQVPLDAPVASVYEGLAHADLFLYVCMHVERL